MTNPPEPKINKLAADWVRLNRAAALSRPSEPVRSYDRRYQAEISHERAYLEAMLAAALAREYVDKGAAEQRPPAAGPPG
jgi:hypothetical protein